MLRERRQHSRAFKLAVLARMETARDVQALAGELGLSRRLLYRWRELHEVGGPAALNEPGRPRPLPARLRKPLERVPEEPEAASAPSAVALSRAQARIAELERKIGQQQLDLDFFRAALRHVRETRQTSGDPGEKASSR